MWGQGAEQFVKDSKTNKNTTQIQMSAAQFKTYIDKMDKKKRRTAVISIVGVLLFCVLLTLFLNNANSKYVSLYPEGMAPAEVSQVFTALKEMGADVSINETGGLDVLAEEQDLWLFQLAAQGYPKSVLSYDIFDSKSGMTTTQSERSQILIYQLQDRIQLTLKRISGVEDAVVTLNMAKTSDNIWDEATVDATGSASVLLTLRDGVTFDDNQVIAVKNLVASAVPDLTSAQVSVVDARTALELGGRVDDDIFMANKNLEFEQIVQKQIEDNIMRLFAPRYGANGVVATAKVTINYDKMLTEHMQYENDPNGDGFLTSTEGQFGLDGDAVVGGIAGEEDNTDIPEYPYVNPDGEDVTDYRWNNEYQYSYLKTQIEKGQADLERATISVLVDEESLSPIKRNELIGLISNSVDIAPENISVSTISIPAIEEDVLPPVITDPQISDVPLWVYMASGGVLLLILVLIIIFILARKKKKEQASKLAEAAAQQADEEIADYKKQITEAANIGVDAKGDAIVGEVREFAKVNPEVTASLIRSWLKDGE